MKTRNKKKIVVGNPPKAFVGMAMAGLNAGMSIYSGIKAKQEAKKAATEAERSALTQQRSADKLELEDYPEEGFENVNYYQAGGGKINVRNKNKTEPTEKELSDKEVSEVKQASGVDFDDATARRLFTRTSKEEDIPTSTPSLDFGKYKKVGYFEMGNTDGNTMRVRNTKSNPHNPSTIRPVMDEIRKLNPGKNIELDFAYKAGGGKLAKVPSHDTVGGKLNKLSSDMELAEGNKHESSKIDNTSGIKLIQGNKAIAEIEDDETIKDGDLVYSDRLKASNGKTFADNAATIARKKGKAENRMGKGDSISKATTERKVGMLDMAENALFAEQEQYKKDNGIEQNEKVPKANFGAVLGKVAGKAAPYIDNVANAAVSMFMTPKVPKPSYVKARKFNTNVNVNPQLNAVSDAEDSAVRTMMDNTSNSNTARNNIASVRLKGAGQKAGILANKEEREDRLEDRNTQMQLHTDMINSQKRDQLNNMNMARQGQIKTEISQNFANLSGDLVDAENNKRDEKYNAEKLAAFRTAYDKNGIVDRSDDSMMKWMELMMKKKNGGKLKNK